MTTTHDAIANVAEKMTYGGAGGAVIFGMTANEFAAYSGVAIGIIGVIISSYFKWLERKDRLEHNKKLLEDRK